MHIYTLTVAQAMACSIVLLVGALLLNDMTDRTAHWRKLAYVSLVTAGGWGLLRALTAPTLVECTTAAVIAALLLAEWRITHAEPGATA